MGATYAGNVIFYGFLLFHSSIQLQPIFVQTSSKDAVWSKEEPFWDEKCVVVKFGRVLH